MPYKLKSINLMVADKEVYLILRELIKVKNEYKGDFQAEYSRTIHILDLLQYTVVGTNLKSSPREEIERAKAEFEIAKLILNQDIINKIQYCIDTLEPFVQASELMCILRR